MKPKVLLSFAFILFILTVGYITNSQSSNNQGEYILKYSLKEGEQYDYNVQTIVEKSSKNVLEHVQMDVVGVDDNAISLEARANSGSSVDSKEGIFYITMTPYGKIDQIDSQDLIIPEIQLEVVSILEYPEKEFKIGNTWSSDFNRSGSYFVDNNSIEYTVFGNTTYECLGGDKLSVKGGKFDCVSLATTTCYTLDAEYEYANKSLHLITTGTTKGENWISVDKGILIKSEYSIDKNTKGDYSDIYKDVGVKNAYRDTPFKIYVTRELVDVKGA
ncbi:hypothetical protein [Methanolobus sp. WCC5]|uniref:hypothetical protein n=1 Tax=Methanolobus sp. WCC5 TaxID=3125785 RepID=UPI003247FFDD